MLTRLHPDHYPAIRTHFRALASHVQVLSILDGNTRGQVFVDNPEAPAHLVIWDELATLFVAGPGENTGNPATGSFTAALHTWIGETVMPQAQRWGIPDLTLIYDPPAWRADLSARASRYSVTPAQRYHYIHTGTPQPATLLPDGYTLYAIDAALLAHPNLPGLDWLGGWILSFWPTPEAFLDRGLGYVVLAESSEGTAALVSLCISVFVSGTTYEFGTATDEAHRSIGLSTAATCACVNAGLSRGMDLVWQCWADNGPSVAVARKSGFRLVGHHEVLRLWWPGPEEHSRAEG